MIVICVICYYNNMEKPKKGMNIVMSNFDSFIDKAREVADVAVQKTGEIVEISKVRLQAIKLNHNIQRSYERLGSMYYDSIKFGADSQDLLDACVKEIDDLLIELEKLNNIAHGESGGEIRCDKCGFENVAEAFFCARCGAPFKE